jgi:hypothetical protein
MDLGWLEGLDAAITACDAEGVIVYLNARAAEAFREDGGMGLVGKSLYACHDERANAEIRRIMRERIPNAYTTEKNGKKKLIWQAPWHKGGEFAGLVEIAVPIPFEMPHFVRAEK